MMIRKKESIYQRDKKKFMNTTGTWVADMNLKKMATKNTVMQKKLKLREPESQHASSARD